MVAPPPFGRPGPFFGLPKLVPAPAFLSLKVKVILGLDGDARPFVDAAPTLPTFFWPGPGDVPGLAFPLAPSGDGDGDVLFSPSLLSFVVSDEFVSSSAPPFRVLLSLFAALLLSTAVRALVVAVPADRRVVGLRPIKDQKCHRS